MLRYSELFGFVFCGIIGVLAVGHLIYVILRVLRVPGLAAEPVMGEATGSVGAVLPLVALILGSGALLASLWGGAPLAQVALMGGHSYGSSRWGFCVWLYFGLVYLTLRQSPMFWLGAKAVAEWWVGLLILPLVWCFIGQVSSILAVILLLEVALVAVLALLCVSTLAEATVAVVSPTGLRPTPVSCSRQAVFTFLSAVLYYTWFMGIATLGLVWALGAALPELLTLDPQLWGLTAGVGGADHQGYGGITPYLVGLMLLTKLVLQPAQLLILAVYRSLSAQALALYVLVYYLPSLPVIFFVLLTPMGGVLLAWHWVFLLTSFGMQYVLLASAGSVTDFRVGLAYSTMVNLGLVLLVVGFLVD